MCQFSDKTDNFDFFGPNLSKNGFWGWNSDSESASEVRIQNQHLQDTKCANLLSN